MANYKLVDLEGIGPQIAAKFEKIDIRRTDQLLKACAKKSGRKHVAEQTGLTPEKVLKYANMADLYRIKGVGSEYSELLEATGVDTVAELATRNPENLTTALVETNEKKKLVRRIPVIKMVRKWVAQAKELPRILEY
ncbi:DUF4332 domain-containing protein [Porphyromonas pogonae]|uniref:DUF4332 domain-containing protein n=1 Tax=Porphyromonas pogonae TaxID=867595 RepID=UPI002E784179|nr:DUF4332 domain-containing protein [Porphyromonas pogonae]